MIERTSQPELNFPHIDIDFIVSESEQGRMHDLERAAVDYLDESSDTTASIAFADTPDGYEGGMVKVRFETGDAQVPEVLRFAELEVPRIQQKLAQHGFSQTSELGFSGFVKRYVPEN